MISTQYIRKIIIENLLKNPKFLFEQEQNSNQSIHDNFEEELDITQYRVLYDKVLLIKRDVLGNNLNFFKGDDKNNIGVPRSKLIHLTNIDFLELIESDVTNQLKTEVSINTLAEKISNIQNIYDNFNNHEYLTTPGLGRDEKKLTNNANIFSFICYYGILKFYYNVNIKSYFQNTINFIDTTAINKINISVENIIEETSDKIAEVLSASVASRNAVQNNTNTKEVGLKKFIKYDAKKIKDISTDLMSKKEERKKSAEGKQKNNTELDKNKKNDKKDRSLEEINNDRRYIQGLLEKLRLNKNFLESTEAQTINIFDQKQTQIYKILHDAKKLNQKEIEQEKEQKKNEALQKMDELLEKVLEKPKAELSKANINRSTDYERTRQLIEKEIQAQIDQEVEQLFNINKMAKDFINENPEIDSIEVKPQQVADDFKQKIQKIIESYNLTPDSLNKIITKIRDFIMTPKTNKTIEKEDTSKKGIDQDIKIEEPAPIDLNKKGTELPKPQEIPKIVEPIPPPIPSKKEPEKEIQPETQPEPEPEKINAQGEVILEPDDINLGDYKLKIPDNITLNIPSHKFIFKIPQLDGGYKELGKILTDSKLLLQLKKGNRVDKQFEKKNIKYGYYELSDQEIEKSVKWFTDISKEFLNSMDVSAQNLQAIEKDMQNPNVIGRILNNYFDNRMIKVNEYLLIDDELRLYVLLGVLIKNKIDLSRIAGADQLINNKNPIVLKASTDPAAALSKLENKVDLSNRITIQQMFKNRKR